MHDLLPSVALFKGAGVEAGVADGVGHGQFNRILFPQLLHCLGGHYAFGKLFEPDAFDEQVALAAVVGVFGKESGFVVAEVRQTVRRIEVAAHRLYQRGDFECAPCH